MKNKHPVFKVFGTTIKEHAGITCLLVAAIAGTIITGILPPLVLGTIIDELTAKKGPVLSFVIFYFGLLVIAGVFDSTKEGLITIFGQKMTHGLRREMSEKMSHMPTSYLTGNEPGAITSRMVNDVDTVESLFTSGVISMFTDVCKVISILIVVFYKSKGLGLLLLVATPVLYVMTRVFQKKMLVAQLENRIAVGEMNQLIPETLENIRTIHVFHKEDPMCEQYDKAIKRSFSAMEHSNFYDAIYSPIIITISAVIVGVMMELSAQGGIFLNYFGMTVGTAVAVIAYVGKIFDPLESIGMEIQNIQSAVAGVKRIKEFLMEEEIEVPAKDQKDMRENAVKENCPAVEIDHIDFAYGKETRILGDFSLKVMPGEAVTLTGRTGAGKSTLFKLILGLYAPDAGTVRIFGRPAECVAPEDRRELFGYVEQKFRMIPGSVADQISLKENRITRQQIEKSISLVGLDETIRNLDEGLDTICSEKLFSQGQMQLLSIARAIVCDPSILLLDEITANLDSLTEKQVLTALLSASNHRTVISISHRLYEQTGGRRVEIK